MFNAKAGPNSDHFSNWMEDARRTGELFPGRPIVRPRVKFENNRKEDGNRSCSKKYRYSRAHSPGLFTVQCTCSQPKILGISVMEEPEGISNAFSVLFSRFRVLPYICLYDNACNASASAAVRFPWINDHTNLLVDRFHYKSHKCSSVFDANAYPICDSKRTSGAESLNRVWSSSKSHVRFLNPDNLMPFIAIRAAFTNIKSWYRHLGGKNEIDYSELREFAKTFIKCNCSRCAGNRN